MNCSELNEGQLLFCKGCGFEFEVVNECVDNYCTTEACCNFAIQCCRAPMELR